MSDIRIIEKPSEVSFEVIRSILQRAHAENIKNGIIMHTTELSADELEAYLGDEGKCYLAVEGEKILGTASFRIRETDNWYSKGRVVDEVLVGILPEYRGKHIYSMLYQEIENYAVSRGFSKIIFNTAAANKKKQEACIKKGFQYVSYFVASDNDHYSVIMAKWLNGCPYSKFEMWYRYHIRKWLVTLRYKPGRIKRFGI